MRFRKLGGNRSRPSIEPPELRASRNLGAVNETLRRMASVDRYNDWIFRKLRKHIGQDILEVGCGLGNMTPYFLGRGSLTCLDVEPASVALVREKFTHDPTLRVVGGDICDGQLVDRLLRMHACAGFDTVACINVLEHIGDDVLALRHMRRLLQVNGKLLLFVPAGPYLFGHLDRALGHYRRYSLEPLTRLLKAEGYRIEEAFYLNAAGIPGWFLSSRVLRRSVPPSGLLWLFNLLAPIFIVFEEFTHPRFGQSIVCVASRLDS